MFRERSLSYWEHLKGLKVFDFNERIALKSDCYQWLLSFTLLPKIEYELKACSVENGISITVPS